MAIGALGVSLPPPQALYPVSINKNPNLAATNRVSLPPGGAVLIPPGSWLVTAGQYSMVQWLDPVTNTWTPFSTQDQNCPKLVNSDGYNYRILNPLGFPIGAVVNANGTGYTSGPAVATGSGQGATWTSLIGGGVSAINCTTGGSGLNYAVPPIVNIAAPPSPGVPATAVCAISGGQISSFTIVNPGAGYAFPPTVYLKAQANDQNLLSSTVSVTEATATSVTSYVGQVTAILLANQGSQPTATVPALSLTGGGGSGATATAVMALTATGYTVTTPGSGYAGPVVIQTSGGLITSAAATVNSPAISTGLLIPRNANIIGALANTGVTATGAVIVDGGVFQQPPSGFPVGPVNNFVSGSGNVYVNGVIAITTGYVNDTVFVTPTGGTA